MTVPIKSETGSGSERGDRVTTECCWHVPTCGVYRAGSIKLANVAANIIGSGLPRSPSRI